MRWWLFFTFLPFVSVAGAWHGRLACDGGGYWRTRAVVIVENPSDKPQIGAPVTLRIGKSLPDLPFANKEAKAIRVCDERGRELKFDLRTPQGEVRRTGFLQAGDLLSFLAEVPAKGVARYFVYADNPKAWVVPDYLKTGLTNGSFEAGDKDPTDWERVEEDAQHRLFWVEGVARTGKRSVQTVVSEGAQPTWVKFHQTHIPLVPGMTYRFRGWVKAEKVKGFAGWFIHVFGEKGEWLINRVLNAGGGTYDWNSVEFTFTAPENARWATVGTVLFGTGIAWFDDASLEPADKFKQALRARVATVETRLLTLRVDASNWSEAQGWDKRVPLVVYNFENQTAVALVFADLRKVMWRFSALEQGLGIKVVDPEAKPNERIRPHWWFGSGILFFATIPPRSAKRFDLYISETQPSEGEASYEELLSSPTNLVPNPSFERGGDLPAFWQSDQRKGVKAGRVQEGKFGQWAAKLEVEPELKGQWVGWRLSIAAKPNQLYFYCGFVKAEGDQARVRLHGHWHNAKRQLCEESPFFATVPEVTGGQGWVQTAALVESPPDAAFVEFHLTTNTPGTFWHDGIFFGEVYPAVVGEMERREPATAKGLSVWLVNPLVKVFPETLPEETPKLVSLLMARNEYEPIQIALRSDRKIQQVRVEVTPPKNQHGQTLPQPQIYRVGFVPIDHPSGYYTSQLPPWYRHVPKGFGGSDGWAGEWADPLMPFKPFDLQPNRTEAIWLVLYVPLDAQPGQYEGQVRVIAENQTISLPLRVEVVPLTLPEETELKVIFDLRGAIVGRLLAEPERLKAWYRSLASFRISPGFVLPEPTFRYENGKVTMEASGFDEMAKLLIDELKVSVLYTPSFTYAFGWAYPPKRFFNLEPFTEEYNRAYQELLRVFYDHLRRRGWSDKFVYYISDEPHFWNENIRKQMKQLCSLAHQAVPGIRIYSSTWQFVPEWVGDLDIWGIGPHGSCSVADMERLKSAGAELWFTTDGHMCIDTPYLAIERLLPYLCFAYGVSGYEFWGVSWWTYDPWEYGWHSYIRQSDEGERFYWIRYPNGDGYLVYPGDKFGLVEPLPSIRLMQVREGIEDYLLLRAIERALKEGKWQGEKAEAAKRILERARSLVSIPNEGGLRSTSLLPDPNKVTEIRDDALKLWR